jgi:hypothetical protein
MIVTPGDHRLPGSERDEPFSEKEVSDIQLQLLWEDDWIILKRGLFLCVLGGRNFNFKEGRRGRGHEGE